ncbi:DUF998 domain-containing protein [Kribbella sp. VKM Ac-2568]|uniref:DUF998 domain-containing protein n=1 Tax=Kribbella sp. VKM Ac-2568 TaxID=2512219 RepID=UPI00104EE06C|nr:DUF998 domain-containing protein [Kribbella sp. VKM Ac-2568]TCM44324.1 uncharacterized protein DUF998 [Kribbella sp. VKM Ac-2568]
MKVTTDRLVAGGVVAGPLFLAVWAVQAFTREGFDPGRHPISLLALGGAGWVQIANFVLTGSLYVAAAVGLKRAGQGTWGPRLIGAFGVGLIVAGVFVTDPGAGFPEGAPEGAGELSWHGVLHEVGFGIAQLAWTAAAIVFARRFKGRARWATVGTIAAALAVAAWPDLDSLSIRLVIASAIQFAFVAVLCRTCQPRRVATAEASLVVASGDWGRKR